MGLFGFLGKKEKAEPVKEEPDPAAKEQAAQEMADMLNITVETKDAE